VVRIIRVGGWRLVKVAACSYEACSYEPQRSMFAFVLPSLVVALASPLSVDSIGRLLGCGQRGVIVMLGAGASVSASIPEFRTPGTGLYDNLYDIPGLTGPFDFDGALGDAAFLGDCNNCVRALAAADGWADQLEALCMAPVPVPAGGESKRRAGQAHMSLAAVSAADAARLDRARCENVQAERLLGTARPRAALRRYERALSALSTVDPYGDDAWFAYANAALCVVRLAELHRTGPHATAWASALGPGSLLDAQRWLLCALTSTPNDANLLDLEARLRACGLGAGRPTGRQAQLLHDALRGAATSHRRLSGAALARSWEGGSGRASSASAAGETLVIAFAGADAVGRGSIRGGVPSHEFVASCRRAGVRFALFVRDVTRGWYLRGIGTDSGDIAPDSAEEAEGFEGMVRLLRSEIAALRPSRVVTIGSSMGGYAAVRAALELDADAALAFAPQTTVNAAARAAARLPPATFDPLLEGLAAFARAEPRIELRGLDAVVGQLPPGHGTQLEVHVGGDDDGDVREAQLLCAAVDAYAQRAAPSERRVSCDVHIRPGGDHNLVVGMRDSGELQARLEALIQVDGTRDASAGAWRPSVIREDFVGFENCPDF
jgi:hypothetical protein